MKTYKISIPKPCHEDWNTMTPTDKGKFCDSCAKNVIDFTNMSDAEIKNYLITKKEERVCGHFRKQQLDTITIEIPRQVLFSQTQFRKIFLLALLFTMGTTLLSCADEAGNKQKIENVVIARDTITPESNNGAPKTKTEDTKPLPPPRVTHTTGIVAMEPAPEEYLTGEVAPDFEEEKENNHITGDTIITPKQ